jgi:hypothetical protein
MPKAFVAEFDMRIIHIKILLKWIIVQSIF